MTDTPNRQTTASPTPTCRWCGGLHGVRCPSVAAMEFHPDGSVKRVEFVQPPAAALLGPTGLFTQRLPDGQASVSG